MIRPVRNPVRLGRWFITFRPGPRAVIVEFRPRSMWSWRHWWLSAHFGRLPEKPVIRWRVGPLILDRYRI
jgi:hypothetical protein